ncbi:MAG: ferrochelatase, partial [Proteobacteria bacterium]|nr:ferrochelatase [Pseudomonadota bacterium]
RNAPTRPDKLILSYHGVPKRYVANGDPYCCECVETTKLLSAKLSVPRAEIIHTFQSRFGREPWLTPYTDDTLEKLAHEGVKHLAVACPGFVADCLETIDEIGIEGAEEFIEAGGKSLTLVPCVNDSEPFIDCLEAVVKDTAGSWLGIEEQQADDCARCVCPAVGE